MEVKRESHTLLPKRFSYYNGGMRDVDIAWAVGLFEGEGCIGIWKTQKDHVLPLIRLTVAMTDRDVVERFCRIVECGRVSPEKTLRQPTKSGRPRKPVHVWQISNRADVERLLLAFRPWLGARRSAKADEVLAEIAKLDMVCENCGVKFRSHRISSRFCSVKCRNRWHYMNRRPAERPSQFWRPRVL